LAIDNKEELGGARNNEKQGYERSWEREDMR
jgi:hypothetical protein